MNHNLKEKLKTLPAAPGVYFHKNYSGEVIYVGKAAVLKNRVRQYFHQNIVDPKTVALVEEISDIDFIVTDSEMDALFLESEMIKRYRPKWNILLKDDKAVVFVRIDLKSQIPTVTTTRTPLDDGATYIGPFYGKTAIIKSLKILRKVFPFYDKPYRPEKDLYTDLGLTPGIEVGLGSQDQYKKDLKKLISYLKGNRKLLLKELEKQMKLASVNQDFESAAKFRNQLFGLKELSRKIIFSDQEHLDLSKDNALRQIQQLLNLKNPPRRIEGYDISHHAGENAVASMVVFQNGVSTRQEYRKFKIKHSKNNDFQNLQEVLTRRLRHDNWPMPDLVLIDGGKPQLEAVAKILTSFNLPYIGLAEEFDHVVLPLPDGDFRTLELSSNSDLLMLLQRIRDEAHRFAITYHTHLKNKQLFL